jgi:hypothetical protein
VHPQHRRVLPRRQGDLGDGDPAGLLHRRAQQRVRLDRGRLVGADVVGLAEVDRVDLGRVHEPEHVHRLLRRHRQLRQVLVGDDDAAPVLGFVLLRDLRIGHLRVFDFAESLEADAAVIAQVRLMHRELLLLGGRVERDRDGDQAEADEALPRGHGTPRMR